MSKPKCIAGAVIGDWTLVQYIAGSARPRRSCKWLCRCSCGIQRAVQANNLRRGVSTSCGHDLAEKMAAGMRRYHETRDQSPIRVRRPQQGAQSASPWDILLRYRTA